MTNTIIKTELVKASSTNPRQNFRAVADLVESIRKVGLLQPILVRKDPKSEGYVVVDGECRLRAMRELKKAEIPVYVVEFGSEQDEKEAQMMANLTRSDLAWIERARGYQGLLENAPAKYNELVIANRFGLKEKQVKAMIRIVSRIDPILDADLASGHFDVDDIETLCLVQKEYQKVVVAHCVKKREFNVSYVIRHLAVELHFDNVFNREKARAAGKIHYENYGSSHTFDREYGAEVKKEFEARTKKSYSAEKKKAKSEQKALTAKQIERKRAERDKKKSDVSKTLADLKAVLTKFLAAGAPGEAVKKMRTEFANRLSIDDCKLLLRAWGVEFKASELSGEQIRKLLMQRVLDPIVVNERSAAMLYAAVSMNFGFSSTNDVSGLKAWIRQMKAY